MSNREIMSFLYIPLVRRKNLDFQSGNPVLKVLFKNVVNANSAKAERLTFVVKVMSSSTQISRARLDRSSSQFVQLKAEVSCPMKQSVSDAKAKNSSTLYVLSSSMPLQEPQ